MPSIVERQHLDFGGRPTKYQKEFAEMANIACSEMGATLTGLARLFNVGPTTIRDWKRAHEDFAVAVDEGRDLYDSNKIEAALRKRALGYKYNETRIERISVRRKDMKGKMFIVPAKKITKTTKAHAPDVSAIEMWLYNRMPHRWRSRKFVKVDSTERKELTLRLKVEELKRLEVPDLEQLLAYLARLGLSRGSRYNAGGDGTGREVTDPLR